MSSPSTSELQLRNVLVVEDDAAILDFTCRTTGYLLWPLIRIQFLRFILSDLLYGKSLIETSGVRVPYGTALGTLLRGITHNAMHLRSNRAPVMLMGTGFGNYLKDGRWFNRLTDHFVAAHPDSFTVEDFADWRWPFPRFNNKILFHAPLQVQSAILGKLQVRQAHLDDAAQLVGLVRARAQRYLQWDLGDERAAFLIKSLARHCAALPLRRRAYECLLSRNGVRLVIKEEGCYGPSSVLLATARNMGIVTAEYQHGSVSAGNDAYNLAPALLASAAYRRTLPEYFLGYGKWWNEQINVPVKKLAIGNPHRSEQLAGRTPLSTAEKRDILILGDGIETAMYLNFALNIAQGLDSRFRVVFRPHPLERQSLKTYWHADMENAVYLDTNADIYQSFATAHAVASEVSTGLFEAIGVADRIFIWDTPKSRFCYPHHPFEVARNGEDLAAQIRTPQTTTSRVDPEDIWASGWRENYLAFLNLALGDSSHRSA